MEREDAAGGSTTLGELIDQHGAALYYDFKSLLGIDLIAVVAMETSYTPRLLLYLIDQFPEGSAFAASVAGEPERRFFGTTESLLASIHNAVQINTMVVGGIPQKDRKMFHLIEAPWAKKAAAAMKAKAGKVGKSGAAKALALLGGAQFDELPEHMREKPGKKHVRPKFNPTIKE